MTLGLTTLSSFQPIHPTPLSGILRQVNEAKLSPFTHLLNEERVPAMFYTIAVVLVVLWLLGLVTSYTMGGFIHILLVIAIIAVLYRIISGRKLA
jgi:hypothetical protein